MMQQNPVPDFVLDGAFNWYEKGYHYTLGESDKELVLSGRSDNPWFKIAHVVERAKTGDFSQADQLTRFFDYNLNTNAAPAALLLTGAMGRRQDLSSLTHVMKTGSDGFRVYACKAASISGCLWMVPYMLEAWHGAESLDAHENIGYAIADMLDPTEQLEDMGPIASLAGSYSVEQPQYLQRQDLQSLVERVRNDGASAAFHDTVTASFDRLRTALGTEDAVVWRGKLSGVRDFAQLFLEQITSPDFSIAQSAMTVILRHKFEAATGIDCSSFFEKGRLRQLVAASVIEDFLDRTASGAFEENRRYFFGHRIES